MCAIFGWFGSDNIEKLYRMADTLRHRGPDGDGFFHTEVAALGMTRLAILDLDRGQQPFHSNDGKISVVCNGEIYNFQEIKDELIGAGYSFKTDCDCEVLPAAYQEWGINFLDRVNGMFAMAIFDHAREQLMVVRDRCGQKPLYYTHFRGNVYFSSEIRALHEIGLPKAINRDAIPAYLSLRYVPEPQTMFRDVKILPVGSYLTFDKLKRNGVLEKWYYLPLEKVSYDDPSAYLYSLTQSSVQDALISDVPMALYLSAGVDSSVLLAEIQHSGKSIRAVTAGFGAHSDEVLEAAKMCDLYDVQHSSVQLSAGDIGSLPEVISQMELPVGDALILAFDRLAETTASLGCKVAIGGEGVDEIFAGYSFQKLMKLSENMGPVGRWLVGCGLGLAPGFLLDKLSSFPAALGVSGRNKINSYLMKYHTLSDYEKGVNLRTLFSATEMKELGAFSAYHEGVEHRGNLLESHMHHQFRGWLQDWSIIRQERNTMAHSVEYRMPFLDHKMLDFGMSLQNNYKISGLSGKHVWREMAAKYYPETQHKRTKQPFFFPTEEAEYYTEISKLLDSTIGSDRFAKNELFDMEWVRNLRLAADKSREFLPIKQLLSIAILDLWVEEHGLSYN